ncbi:hypothetical protein BX600DRAFT_470453 [Xylariales sp. PMI_506]|nr:hypothetical protein BX600DRAFT_470453 [Xylariales sp. PMI_506]
MAARKSTGWAFMALTIVLQKHTISRLSPVSLVGSSCGHRLFRDLGGIYVCVGVGWAPSPIVALRNTPAPGTVNLVCL